MTRILTLPAISEVPTDVTIVRIHAQVGDALLKDQPLLDIATEKVDLEIPAPYDLWATEVHVSVGDKVETGSALITVTTREDSTTCTGREGLANVITGLRYLAKRNAQSICCRSSLGQYTFEHLKPFVAAVASLSETIMHAGLDSLDEGAIENLRDTLYQITQYVTKMESFDVKSIDKPADHAHILRTVAESQDVMLSRLFRAEAHVKGKTIEPLEELRKASVIYNPGRAYVFVSYHHNDLKAAKRLDSLLNSRAIGHFLDIKGIPWGSEVPRRIHSSLEMASHIVVMISPGSVSSPWVAYEVGFARGAGKEIVPYLLHPSMQMPSFLLQLRHLQTERDVFPFIEELKKYRRTPATFSNPPQPRPVQHEIHETLNSYSGEISAGHPLPLGVERILPVVAHAVAVFGDEKKAHHWLVTPLPLFGDRSPAQLLEAPDGIELVEQVLTRIEHNIPS